MDQKQPPSGPFSSFTRTDSVAQATIAANVVNDVTVAESRARTTDQISTTPQGAAVAGLVWCAFCTTAGVITIRRANVMTGSITPATTTYVTRIERHVLP